MWGCRSTGIVLMYAVFAENGTYAPRRAAAPTARAACRRMARSCYHAEEEASRKSRRRRGHEAPARIASCGVPPPRHSPHSRSRRLLGNACTSLLGARRRFQRAPLGDNGIDSRVVRRGRDALDNLQVERAGDACGAILEERE